MKELTHKQIVEIKDHLSNNSWSYECVGEDKDTEKAMLWLERHTFGLSLVKNVVDSYIEDLEDKQTTFEIAQEIANDVAYAKLDAHGMISEEADDVIGYHLGDSTTFNLEIL